MHERVRRFLGCYISEGSNGRAQKFVPREGGDPDLVISRAHPTY
jgi:hypothetical protein